MADDKLYGVTYCKGPTPSSGTEYAIQVSNDNFGSATMVAHQSGGLGCCNVAFPVSYNDSTLSYFTQISANLSGNLLKLMLSYTFNGFRTLSSSNLIIDFEGAGSAITEHFVYELGKTDSLRLYRIPRMGAGTVTNTVHSFSPMNNKLRFMNDSVGFMLAYFNSNALKSTLLKSTDRGKSWTSLIADSVDAFVDLQVIPSGDIYLLKKSGASYKSSNAGLSFSPLTPVSSGTYTCIHFANSTGGLIGGINGALYKTLDGGLTWTSEASNTNNNITSIYAFNSTSYFEDHLFKVYRSTQPLGIRENALAPAFSIAPNPANSFITISCHTEHAGSLTVADITGKEVLRASLEEVLQLDVSELSAGVYFVQLETAKGRGVKKLVIQH